ncbi:MAG: hypothetical protein V9G12_08725 [Microthrixaceae bacterium]
MADDPLVKPLTVWQHTFGIMASWPGKVRIAQVPDNGGGVTDELRWEAEFTPTKLSCTYTVRFTYKVGDPIVWVQVVDPVLDPGAGKQLPHVYEDSTQRWLCLHLEGQWDQTMAIATTVVPWAAEWLFHYELWLATGEWTGSGERYERDVRPIDGRRLRRPAPRAAPLKSRARRRAERRASSRR